MMSFLSRAVENTETVVASQSPPKPPVVIRGAHLALPSSPALCLHHTQPSWLSQPSSSKVAHRFPSSSSFVHTWTANATGFRSRFGGKAVSGGCMAASFKLVRNMVIDPETKNESSTNNDKEENKQAEEKQDLKDEKTEVLRAALSHVPRLGWSDAALIAGARDVGLSPAIVGALQRKEAALVEFFMDECLEKFLDEVESHKEELSNMLVRDRLAKLIRLRLEMQIPFVSRWAQALSIQANPLDFPKAFNQRAVLIDEIWRAAGDRSSDMDWYTKRALLAGVYTATELYMLTDHSTDFKDTWTFLEKRIVDVLECRKTAEEEHGLAIICSDACLGLFVKSNIKKGHVLLYYCGMEVDYDSWEEIIAIDPRAKKYSIIEDSNVSFKEYLFFFIGDARKWNARGYMNNS